jgi:hypothetical protein
MGLLEPTVEQQWDPRVPFVAQWYLGTHSNKLNKGNIERHGCTSTLFGIILVPRMAQDME